MIIPVTRNPINRFTVARLHYSMDPEKADPAWIERTKRGMPESGWMREYEIDYSTYSGKAVYAGDFRHELHVRPLENPSREILYVGWDFGYHRPAVLITKVNEFDQWLWLKAILGQDEGIDKFGERIQRFLMTEYPGCKFLHACDPAGHQKTDKAEKTSIQVLEDMGIFPVSRPSAIVEGIEIIRKKLAMRDDGKVGLLINQTEENLIEGFKGGYRYPEFKEGQPEKEEPLKDGFYDHLFDCGRYLAVNFFTLVDYGKQETNPITRDEVTPRGDPNRNVIDEGEGIADLF